MKTTALVLTGLLAAASLAACANGSSSTVPSRQLSSRQALVAGTPYHFSIENLSDADLQIVNEPDYGQCVAEQFPSKFIDPKSTLKFVVETLSSGRCALAVKGGLVTLDYGRGVLYVEYYIKPGSKNWDVEGVGRGRITSFTGPAPIETICYLDHRSGDPACVVRTGKPH